MKLFDIHRREEISKLLHLSEDEVIEKAGKHLQVFKTLDDIHRRIANDMIDFIEQQNQSGKPSCFIVPVGPVGQYNYFLEHVHQRKIGLKNCWFFYMDEHADDSGHSYSPSHPLSFQGEIRKLWLDKIDPELAIPESQIFFPNHTNIQQLADIIEKAGGIDYCFGGIGIHGHVAFNEPEPGVRDSDPRLVYLNDITVTINAIRSKVGGNLEAFPKKAYTLGMKQILGARKIRLACRNGIPLDWANTVLRLTLFGIPGDDYPCTYINQHQDYVIYTDLDTLKSPENIL